MQPVLRVRSLCFWATALLGSFGCAGADAPTDGAVDSGGSLAAGHGAAAGAASGGGGRGGAQSAGVGGVGSNTTGGSGNATAVGGASSAGTGVGGVGGASGVGSVGGLPAAGSAGTLAGSGGVGAAGAASVGGAGDGSGAGMSGGGQASGAGGMAGAGNASSDPTLTQGTCKSDLGGANNGSVTYYTFSMGTTLVNCSYGTHKGNPDTVDFVATNSGQYFAAINTADYNGAATCGACIEVTRDGNRKVTVTVVDQCPVSSNPKCKPGHLDLSQAAFSQIGSPGSEGYLGTGNGGDVGSISWKYVACPSSGNVHLRLKEPTNQAWNEVLVENAKYAITKVEAFVNGAWVNASHTSDNYWLPPNGTFGSARPYRVRVTDLNGTVLEDTVDLAAGDQETDFQMTCK